MRRNIGNGLPLGVLVKVGKKIPMLPRLPETFEAHRRVFQQLNNILKLVWPKKTKLLYCILKNF